jgi:hypothetical protein
MHPVAEPSIARTARVGDILPRRLVDRPHVRRLEATALLLPGSGPLGAYRSMLSAGAADFADWDGRVIVADADGEPAHRLLVVDRYRQVYAVQEATDAGELPDAHELAEWFRFLATACPECGVLDDPLLAAPTP